jgi:hypothetical protein
MNQKKSGRSNLYRAYRKIRFIARKGSLFTLPEKKTIRKSKVPGSTFRLISVNSLALFLLAYLVIYLLNLMITGIAARVSNIPAVLFFDGVDFIIRGKDWTADAINIVFSSGPLFMLFLSAIFIIIYISVETETGILRLLLLWLFFHALTRSMGEILVGTIMNKGFGFVILYLFIMDTGKLVLTISSLIIMSTMGIFLARPSLFSANIYFNFLLKSHRMRFILNQFLLPYFIGNILIFLVKLPTINMFDIAVNASMILFLFPVAVWSTNIEDLYFDEEPRKLPFSFLLIITTVILYVVARIVFGFGIRIMA